MVRIRRHRPKVLDLTTCLFQTVQSFKFWHDTFHRSFHSNWEIECSNDDIGIAFWCTFPAHEVKRNNFYVSWLENFGLHQMSYGPILHDWSNVGHTFPNFCLTKSKMLEKCLANMQFKLVGCRLHSLLV